MSSEEDKHKAQVVKNLYISALVFAGVGVLQKLLVVAGQVSRLTGGKLGVAKLLSNVSNLLIPLAVVLLAAAQAVQLEIIGK